MSRVCRGFIFHYDEDSMHAGEDRQARTHAHKLFRTGVHSPWHPKFAASLSERSIVFVYGELKRQATMLLYNNQIDVGIEENFICAAFICWVFRWAGLQLPSKTISALPLQ